eukprot:TRINITY_DN64304_c0_g1_i1.p1 TRINITY_DN64304_c0_g1~~TRINITY_DN64304_c0_g1_i1.p1  ORF type:complete len:433 (-),score=85.37 TRINITY_DN64304_c0_g1_i1:97-1233(-)
MVMFYAPWCGHCKNAAPEFSKAAKSVKDVIKMGVVDADQHKELGGRFGVRGFPTIKYWGPGKNSVPQDYQGARSAKAFVQHMMSQVPDNVSNVKTAAAVTKLVAKASKKEGLGMSVLLFTEKKDIPNMYKGIAAAEKFKGKLTFGMVVKGSREVVNKFNIEKFPAIILINADEAIVDTFSGAKNTYMDIAKWLLPFVEGDKEVDAEVDDSDGSEKEKKKPAPKAATQSNKPFELSSGEFNKYCGGKTSKSRRLCVVGLLGSGDSAVAEGLTALTAKVKDNTRYAVLTTEDSVIVKAFSAVLESEFTTPTVLVLKQSASGAGKFAQYTKDTFGANDLYGWLDSAAHGEIKFTHVDSLPFQEKEDPDEQKCDGDVGSCSL